MYNLLIVLKFELNLSILYKRLIVILENREKYKGFQ